MFSDDVDMCKEFYCNLPEIVIPIAKVGRVDNDLEVSKFVELVCSVGLDRVHDIPHLVLALDLELTHSLTIFLELMHSLSIFLELRSFAFHGSELL